MQGIWLMPSEADANFRLLIVVETGLRELSSTLCETEIRFGDTGYHSGCTNAFNFLDRFLPRFGSRIDLGHMEDFPD